MIVHYTEDGWQIVTQRSHGLLAGQLAMQWKVSERPDRWTETILAIAEHDDAEVELDGENLLTKQGGPLNFDMKPFDPAHCEKLGMMAITKSRYIALLTSMHLTYLHKKEAKAKAFLTGQRALQKKWRKELDISMEASLKIYALLEWCDALSLLLCKNEEQPEKRSLDISTGPDGTRFKLVKMNDEQLTVHPWPFESSSFQVNFEMRIIPELNFKDCASFRKSFYSAPVQEVSWKMIKSHLPELDTSKGQGK